MLVVLGYNMDAHLASFSSLKAKNKNILRNN